MAALQPEVDGGRVAEFYDEHTDAFIAAWGANLHVGYWHGEHDEASVTEATDHLTDQVAGRLAPHSGDWILDVGCGVGEPAMRLVSQHDVLVVGVTISRHQCEHATDRARAAGLTDRLRFVTADAAELPFPTGCFDGAIALESMIHMPHKERVLAEVRRVLRPGSRFVLADMFSQPGTTLRFHDLITAPEIANYRTLIERSPFALAELTDITANTLAPSSARDRIRETLLARRDEVMAVTGEAKFERMVSDTAIPDSYGYLLATLTAA